MLPIVPAARWSCYTVRAHGGARETGRRPGQPASNTAWSRSLSRPGQGSQVQMGGTWAPVAPPAAGTHD